MDLEENDLARSFFIADAKPGAAPARPRGGRHGGVSLPFVAPLRVARWSGLNRSPLGRGDGQEGGSVDKLAFNDGSSWSNHGGG